MNASISTSQVWVCAKQNIRLFTSANWVCSCAKQVARSWQVADGEEMLVAKACNHPNLLVMPFSFELIRAAA